MILFHNHPTGNPTPSVSDINQTRLVTNACKTMEMQLLDHIIIGAGAYYSFSDEVTTMFKTK
jgi:DNA repair protein RadC